MQTWRQLAVLLTKRLLTVCGDFDSPNKDVAIFSDLAQPLGGEASAWIGLRQVGPAWQWTDGSKKSYTFWEPGMPDGKPGQDCVRLNLKKPEGRWDDIECGNQMIGGAICQVVASCEAARVATPKPTPKRTQKPQRTTPKRRSTPIATRRPPPPSPASTTKPTPKRTTPARSTTTRRRSASITTRPPPTTSPQAEPSKKPEDLKPTTSKPRDCPCRKHNTTRHTPTTPENTNESTKKPDELNEPTKKPLDCGEPPKKPEDP